MGILLGEAMRDCIAPFLARNPFAWTVIPLPLHRRKELARGFNQNDVLTKACFANYSGPKTISVLTGMQNPLRRVKDTKSQITLRSHKRLQNLKGAFTVVNASIIRNKNILLIDDVLTTGATMREAALTLKHAGARHIWGYVLARD